MDPPYTYLGQIRLLLVDIPLVWLFANDPHLSVTTFASLKSIDLSSVVACDIPFGEVCEAFSRVEQNWTKAQKNLDQHPENQPKIPQKGAWLFFTTDLRHVLHDHLF